MDQYLEKLNEIHTDVQVVKTELTHIKEEVHNVKDVNSKQQDQIDELSKFKTGVNYIWGVFGASVTAVFGFLWKGHGG